MEEHQEEVLMAGGRCCWYVMNKMYGRSERDRYILARSLNDEKMQHVGFLYGYERFLCAGRLGSVPVGRGCTLSHRLGGKDSLQFHTRNWIRII